MVHRWRRKKPEATKRVPKNAREWIFRSSKDLFFFLFLLLSAIPVLRSALKVTPARFLNKTFSFIFAFESNGNPLHQRQRLHLHFRGKLIQERFGTFINWHVCNPGLCGRVGLLFRKVLGSVLEQNLFFSCFQTLPTLNQYLKVNMLFRQDQILSNRLFWIHENLSCHSE